MIALRGDRDLSFEELQRRARRLIEPTSAIYLWVDHSQGAEPFGLSVFTDGLPYRPLDYEGHPILPDKRPQVEIARGASWAEVIRRAEIALNKVSA